MADDFAGPDPDPTDPANFILAQRRGSIAQAVGDLDANPDEAARAVELSSATGVPAPVINADLPGFEQQHKAALTASLLSNNDYLRRFIDMNPMAAKVANDDYARLDAISQRVSGAGFNWATLKSSARALVTPPESFGDSPLGSWIGPEDWHNYPLLSSIASVGGAPLELFSRGFNAIATELGTAVAGKEKGEQFAQMVGDPGLAATLEGAGPIGEAVAAPLALLAKFRPAEAWLRSGRTPPPEVMPELAKAAIDVNARDLDTLKELTGEVQQSTLRERSPTLFRDFIRQHTDTEIGISGEAVAALYGDKLPAPDDGLLGWVPGIADKLALARETGTDVSVPLADWLAAENSSELMQALHDDIRVRPGGITAREAALIAEPTSSPLPEEVPTVRAASALEPMFSIGDRNLKLERLAQDPGTKFGVEQGFHDFQMLDEKGNPVGYINLSTQKGGKELYVDMISGVNGLGPRDFGPSLMRSLLRQLKAEFPGAESITGHRVSGAREKAGSWMADSASPVIKLDNPKGWDTVDTANEFRQILEGGQWHNFSHSTRAYLKPYAERSMADRQITDAVRELLNRVVPRKLHFSDAAERIEARNAAGNEGQLIEPTGIYIRYKDIYPTILVSLEGPDPLGSAAHESIHHLRNYGFFTDREWSALERAADEGGWVAKHGIDERYAQGNRGLKLEEAIAEEFMEWRRDPENRFLPPELRTIFEKLQAFYEAIKQRIGELLGKEPTVDDIFKRVETGEIGGRTGTEPLPGTLAFNDKAQAPPEDGPRVFERANAIGMSIEQFKAYDRLIAKRHAEDIAEATKRAEAQKARELTAEWKANRKDLRTEVAADIKQRPDVAADLFFGAGELYGKKVPLASVKLDAEALTDAQKAGLPKHYYGARGLHPDDVANLFGYGSGDALVERLVEYNKAKLAAGGMSAKDFVSRVTDIETDRQMQQRYGNLEENILDAVKEQVAGETQLDLLHEETVALGLKAGVAPLDKATIRQQLREAFAKMPLGSVSSDAYLRAAGRAGRMIEDGLLGDDPAAAFRAKQQQYYATVIAGEAAKLEREIAKFDKVAKRFSKREVPNVDPQYTNYIHDILQRVGRSVRRSVQDLETEIAAGEFPDLKSFVEGKNSFYLREMAVADMLFDPSFRKAFDDLTVDEFRAVDTSIRSLVANGRAELKITRAGMAEDLREIKGQMVNQLREFPEQEFDAEGGRAMGLLPPKIAAVLRGFGIDHLQMETIFNRFDRGDPNGLFQQYVMRDLIAAANSESAKRKVYAKRLMELRGDKADLRQLVDNTIFKVPGTDQLMKLNRGNLRAILLNAGNKSNLEKMARGYGLEPEMVQAWLHRYATAEDWQWAQRVGDIFSDLKRDADVMYRNLSGVAPESIPLSPIATPHGTLPGWYYPLIAHPEFESKGTSRKALGGNGLEEEGFIRATTANGYTKARTGAMYPLALDLDMMPYRIGQMIHDIEMRPAVINASKIFYDNDVRTAIATRFGNEWRDLLVPYLRDVTNASNYAAKNQKRMQQVGEFLRQNLITTLVGINPGTFLKHTPTALVQSIQEVGADRFSRAVRGLWSVNEATGERNWDFAMRESEELQRRHTHFMETLGGAGDQLIPKKGYASLRQTVNYWASYPVAMGDLASATPTWLAQYTKSLEEGATHGDAVYMADRAVRRAHGSTAITNRSAVMRGGYSPWLSSVYGFFNHIMNRQYEALWQAGEAIDAVKGGDRSTAMADAQRFTGQLWAYVLAPAIIEELVSPLTNDEHESWGLKAAKGLTYTLGASWIVVRDLANAILNARDPALGLATTAAKSLTDVARDLAKDKPLGKAHAQKLVKDGATLLGTSTGLMPAQVGRTAAGVTGLAMGTERPQGPWAWMTLGRYGTLDKHPRTFQEWQRHHFGGH